MSLRARVGRHGISGRQCQNWVDDQQQVIDLLNAIPLMHGGAAGSLRGRIVMGIAGEALCHAILRFEDKQFPGQRSGFVDPDGPMWNQMASLTPKSFLQFRFKLVGVKTISWSYD